jgi:2-dehydropantoate 2-reductase
MRIAIHGIGALGCLFGAQLTPHADVILIGRWPEQVRALSTGPLHIIYPDRAVQEVRLNVTNSPAAAGLVDVSLVLTKSSKTERAAQEAAGILKSDGLVVTLQNGIGNLEVLETEVGAERATMGVTTLGAVIEQPGVLRFGGEGLTHIAARPDIDDRVQMLAQLFNLAHVSTHVVADVRGLAWGKLAINAGINPLTALLRVPNGALLNASQARALMESAARETAAVAAALGIELPFSDAAQRVAEVAHMTAANRSSMLQDILRGAKTEIEAINGAVMRAGTAVGIPAPANTLLYQLVRALEETTSDRL